MIKKLSIAFFVFSLLILLRGVFSDYYPDFSVHYYGYKMVLNNLNPYTTKGEMFVPHVYPPFVLLLFYPLSLLNFFISQKIWFFLSLTFLFLSTFTIFKINKKSLLSKTGFLLMGLVFLYFPSRFTLGMGQINNLILFITVLGIYFFNKKDDLKSGILFGLSLSIKFFPLLVVFYFIFLKRYKLLLATFITFLVFFILGFIFVGYDLNIYFYTSIFPSFLTSWKTEYYNQSISALAGRLPVEYQLKEIIKIVTSIFFVIFSFKAVFSISKKEIKEKLNLCLSILIILSLMINNFTWQHHFVLLIFPFLTIIFYLLKNKIFFYKHYVLISLSYLLTALNFKNPSLIPLILQSHLLYGLIILWWVNYSLLTSKRGNS